MAVEPTKRIYETPMIRKGEGTGLSGGKRPKQKKKEREKESGKIDIKV